MGEEKTAVTTSKGKRFKPLAHSKSAVILCAVIRGEQLSTVWDFLPLKHI